MPRAERGSKDDSVRNAGCLEAPYTSVNSEHELGWGAWGEVMRVILDVVDGPLKGRQFVLDRHDTFIVGRSRFVHCPMPEDLALSRDHFMIEVNPPLCELRDLGSTNGTFVNNRRVDRVAAGLAGHDRGGPERLPGGAGGGGIAVVGRRAAIRVEEPARRRCPRPRSGAPAAAPRRRPASRSRARRGRPPTSRSSGGARRVARSRRACPSPSPITPASASWAAAPWAWSTRRGTT